jgi:hypothetical protein
MVQRSEESFVTGCEEVLSKGTSLSSGASPDSAPADVRLAERHGVSSEDHGANAGGDCRNTGEGEQAGAEERRRR